jgi:hypothetical protein
MSAEPCSGGSKMKRIATGGIVAALICCLYVIANGKTGPETPRATTASAPAASTEAKRNEKLRSDVLRLVNDAKAGKLKMPAQQFPPPTHRNNLSTGAKIGIIAGIGGAIFLIWMLHSINSD